MQRRGTELKKTTKTGRQSVLDVAGIEQPLISRKQGLANSVVLGRSWNKHRKEGWFYRSLGSNLKVKKPKEIHRKKSGVVTSK